MSARRIERAHGTTPANQSEREAVAQAITQCRAFATLDTSIEFGDLSLLFSTAAISSNEREKGAVSTREALHIVLVISGALSALVHCKRGTMATDGFRSTAPISFAMVSSILARRHSSCRSRMEQAQNHFRAAHTSIVLSSTLVVTECSVLFTASATCLCA